MPIRALGGAFKFKFVVRGVRENQTAMRPGCERVVFEGRVAIGDTPNAGRRLVLGPNVRDDLCLLLSKKHYLGRLLQLLLTARQCFDGVGSHGRPLYGNNYIVC